MATDPAFQQFARTFLENLFEEKVTGTPEQQARSKRSQKLAGVVGFSAPFILMAGALLAKGFNWEILPVLFWLGVLAISGAVFALIAGLIPDSGRAQNPIPYHFFATFAAVAPIALLIAAFYGFEFKLPE